MRQWVLMRPARAAVGAAAHWQRRLGYMWTGSGMNGFVESETSARKNWMHDMQKMSYTARTQVRHDEGTEVKEGLVYMDDKPTRHVQCILARFRRLKYIQLAHIHA